MIYRMTIITSFGVACIVTLSMQIPADGHFVGNDWTAFCIICFFMAYSCMSLCMEVFSAATNAMYICFAEEPDFVSETFPTIFHRLDRISQLSTFSQEQN